MKEIRTHIDISATAATVWSILADFNTYGRWNPLIRGVLGRADEGRTIEIRVRESGADRRARPRIVRLREFREMQWLDGWRLPGMLSSERRFRIELRPQGVRFHHSEKLGGLLRSFHRQSARSSRRLGMEGMNNALKARAERAGSADGSH